MRSYVGEGVRVNEENGVGVMRMVGKKGMIVEEKGRKYWLKGD